MATITGPTGDTTNFSLKVEIAADETTDPIELGSNYPGLGVSLHPRAAGETVGTARMEFSLQPVNFFEGRDEASWLPWDLGDISAPKGSNQETTQAHAVRFVATGTTAVAYLTRRSRY